MQKLNKTFSGAIWAIVIMALVALGCGRFGGSSNGDIGSTTKDGTIPTVNPSDPIPAISADAFAAMLSDTPELAKYRDELLAAEREAIKGAMDDLRSKAGTGTEPTTQLDERTIVPKQATEAASDGLISSLFGFDLAITAMAAEAPVAGYEQFLIGHQIAYFQPDLDGSETSQTGRKVVSLKDDKTGKVEATATLSVDTPGGPPTIELETSTSIPLFGLEAGSKVSISGNSCPDSSGKVELTVRLATKARSGRAGSVFYDKNIEARIVATVDDAANISGADSEFKQATHSTTGGQQVDFITSRSGKTTGSSYSDMSLGDLKIVRGSQTGTPADQEASDVGLKNAFRLAHGVMESARERWQGGGCVKIQATSPGKVGTGSTTSIPVSVVPKSGTGEVSSKLEVVLSGGESIDPTLIPKTPGTLKYVAPGELGKTAKINLKATSRRGIAKLDLNAETAKNHFRASGKQESATFTGEICNLSNPFEVGVVSITGSWPMKFTPSSELGGQMAGNYSFANCTLSGGGPYTVVLNPDGTGTLTFTFNSTATCPTGSRTTSRKTTLQLQPAPDLNCG